jgi:hypothetical protein
LRRYETAQVLEVNRDQLADLRTKGIAARIQGVGSIRETVTSVAFTDDGAELTTCQVDGAAQVRINDGAVIDDDVVTRASRLSLARNRASGYWQVSPPPARTLGLWDGDVEDRCLSGG